MSNPSGVKAEQTKLLFITRNPTQQERYPSYFRYISMYLQSLYDQKPDTPIEHEKEPELENAITGSNLELKNVLKKYSIPSIKEYQALHDSKQNYWIWFRAHCRLVIIRAIRDASAPYAPQENNNEKDIDIKELIHVIEETLSSIINTPSNYVQYWAADRFINSSATNFLQMDAAKRLLKYKNLDESDFIGELRKLFRFEQSLQEDYCVKCEDEQQKLNEELKELIDNLTKTTKALKIISSKLIFIFDHYKHSTGDQANLFLKRIEYLLRRGANPAELVTELLNDANGTKDTNKDEKDSNTANNAHGKTHWNVLSVILAELNVSTELGEALRSELLLYCNHAKDAQKKSSFMTDIIKFMFNNNDFKPYQTILKITQKLCTSSNPNMDQELFDHINTISKTGQSDLHSALNFVLAGIRGTAFLTAASSQTRVQEETTKKDHETTCCSPDDDIRKKLRNSKVRVGLSDEALNTLNTKELNIINNVVLKNETIVNFLEKNYKDKNVVELLKDYQSWKAGFYEKRDNDDSERFLLYVITQQDDIFVKYLNEGLNERPDKKIDEELEALGIKALINKKMIGNKNMVSAAKNLCIPHVNASIQNLDLLKKNLKTLHKIFYESLALDKWVNLVYETHQKIFNRINDEIDRLTKYPDYSYKEKNSISRARIRFLMAAQGKFKEDMREKLSEIFETLPRAEKNLSENKIPTEILLAVRSSFENLIENGKHNEAINEHHHEIIAILKQIICYILDAIFGKSFRERHATVNNGYYRLTNSAVMFKKCANYLKDLPLPEEKPAEVAPTA